MKKKTFLKILKSSNITWNDIVCVTVIKECRFTLFKNKLSTIEFYGALDFDIYKDYICICVENNKKNGTKKLQFDFNEIIGINKK